MLEFLKTIMSNLQPSSDRRSSNAGRPGKGSRRMCAKSALPSALTCFMATQSPMPSLFVFPLSADESLEQWTSLERGRRCR